MTTPFHPAQMTRERMEKAKKLKLVLTAGIGSDHIDLHAAADRDLTVAEIQGQNLFHYCCLSSHWPQSLAFIKQMARFGLAGKCQRFMSPVHKINKTRLAQTNNVRAQCSYVEHPNCLSVHMALPLLDWVTEWD